MPTPPDAPYKLKQRALEAAAKPRFWASSSWIRDEGLALMRRHDGTFLVPREPRKQRGG